MEPNKGSLLKTSKKDNATSKKDDLQSVDVKAGVDEDGVGRLSKKVLEGEEIPASSQVKPWDTPGFCRKCHIRMNLEEDGRGGMWISPTGSVFVDGCGLCIDCEEAGSVETDPNWGRSRRSSDEEDFSSSGEVSSSTPLKKSSEGGCCCNGDICCCPGSHCCHCRCTSSFFCCGCGRHGFHVRI
ncbi:hypothetical protein RND81_10G201700 [Saponaria officinalis]|uniref:Uncharacterized protein n=1 Tax=Saponaria officinalis TaxID=3572 RepID=A0AAW1I4K9_SAPOF